MVDLLIENVNLATPQGYSPKIGDDQGNIFISQNINIGITNGKISYVGNEVKQAAQVLQGNNTLATPGLVDCHTHLVFGGFRQHELELKLKGADYLQILKSGGGILSTVKATRQASFTELYEKSWQFLNKMLAHGTTTVEVKSGYGLNFDTEIKQLNVANLLSKNHEMDIVCTFMGAHAIPEEFKESPQKFVELIINDLLPHVAKEELAQFCDIFCEDGVFDVEQSRQILQAALNHGFKLKMHANEIVNLGGAVLASELGAISCEHLISSNEEDMQALSKSGTIAVLLPCTSFYLNKPFAKAREMLQSGIPIAISTDFNPGSSPNFNLQLAMNTACLKYKLTPKEVLSAVTLNAACAIGMEGTKGSIEIGKDADIVLWDCSDLDFLMYRYGNNQVSTVIKNGKVLNYAN